jgi:hypothetical protein
MDNESLKKRSRQGAMISSIGFLIIILSFVFASWKLKNMNDIIVSKAIEISTLDSTITRQNGEIESKQKLVNDLVAEINKLRNPAIQPKVRAVEIPGLFDPQNRQIFDFTLWITSSQFTLNRISKVSYYFENATYLLKERESKDNSNGFLISYRGWGCLSVVKIMVEYENGEKETLYFNMCDGLGW